MSGVTIGVAKEALERCVKVLHTKGKESVVFDYSCIHPRGEPFFSLIMDVDALDTQIHWKSDSLKDNDMQ